MMKTIVSFCFFIALVSIAGSCDESIDCPNYMEVEGGMSFNGDLLLPIVGTSVVTTEGFGDKIVTWTAKGAEEDCSVNYTFIFVLNINENDPLTGTFEYSEDTAFGGQVYYAQDENGDGGAVRDIGTGTLVIEDEGAGVFTLDFDGEDSTGGFIDMELRHPFFE